MATCPESVLTTFASDGLPRFDESYSPNVLNIKFDELNHIFTKNANFCYNYSAENVNYGSAELMFYLLFRNFISKQCKESANHATL